MLFHRHKWIVLDKQVFDSPFEVWLANGGKNFKVDAFSFGWFEKEVVVHYKCEKCGTERVTR